MSINKTLVLGGAIKRFEEAVRTHEVMGAQPLEDNESIQQEYKSALNNLTDTIAWVVNDGRP